MFVMSRTGLGSQLAFGLLTAFVVGWYWLPSTHSLGSTPHNLLFYLLVMPWLWLLLVVQPGHSGITTPLMRASGSLILYFAASSLWVTGPIERSTVVVALHALATATFALAIARVFNRRLLDLFRHIVITAAVSITTVSIIAWVFGRTYHTGRLYSAIHFEHPNLFAQYLGFAFLLSVSRILRTGARRRTPVLMVLPTAVLALGLVLTRSRGVMLAVLAAALFGFAIRRGRGPTLRMAAVIAIVSALMLSTGPTFVGFIQRGDAGRIEIWKTLVTRTADRPLIGAGLNARDDVTFPKGSGEFPDGFTVPHVHSALVGAVYFGGLIGLGLLILLVVLAVRNGLRNARDDGEWDPLILLVFGLICLIIDGNRLVSEPHLSSWLLFWLPLGLIAAGPFDRPQEAKSPHGKPAPSQWDHWLTRPLIGGIMLIVLAGVALTLRAPHMGQDIDEPHSWRQCDTAQYIHAFVTDGIDVFHPSVCWMGDHKTLILEFPLYEAVVAFVSGPESTHTTARWISLLFFSGSTFFFFLLVRALFDREIAAIATLVSMVLPLALFYSRAIHIDFSAFFFTHLMAWLWIEAIKRDSARWLWAGSAPAALALIIKAPSVLPFVPLLIWIVVSRRRWRLILRNFPALLLPALIFTGWQWHSLRVNATAPDWFFIPTYRRFTSNAHWYFGPLQMRMRPELWGRILHRILFEITGWIGLGLAVIGLGAPTERNRPALFWWLGGAALGVLVFFNLNVVHNYYQLALVGPISVAMALGIIKIVGLLHRFSALAHAAALLFVLAVGWESVTWAEQHYYEVLEPLRTAGLAIGAVVPEDDLVIVSYGGLDPRSPHLLYRARRYGWSIPDRNLEPSLVNRLEEEGADWLAVVGSRPPTGPLGTYLKGVPFRTINLPGGRTRLFVYHLSDRAPLLFGNDFEGGGMAGWAPPRSGTK
jgi:hypothetical protein